MASDSAEPIERWTAKRRVALVVSILKRETSVAEAASQQHGVTVGEVEEWREKFLLGAQNSLIGGLISGEHYTPGHWGIDRFLITHSINSCKVLYDK